jgi:hypothetical protein
VCNPEEEQMSDLEQAVTAGLERDRSLVRGRQMVIEPAAPTACDTCPWRIRNHLAPPLHKGRRTPATFYTPEARARMWSHWSEDGAGLAGGYRPGCHHQRDEGIERWCAGGDSILQRELLRWWVAGRSRHTFATLTGLEAIHQVLGAVLGVFIGFDHDGHITDDDGTVVRIDLGAGTADVVEPRFDGQPLTLEHVARLAHPGVADPSVGCEATGLPTAAERATWRRLNLGAGWRTGPGRGRTIGIAR